MPLPAPSGPFPVGTTGLTLTDPARPQHLMADVPGRSLLLQLWYPADAPAGSAMRGELVWSGLRRDARTPRLARGLLALLRTRTAARTDAPFAPGHAGSQPLVYHHGLVSFTSENGSLMETLASHGRVAIAIQHREQLPELRALQRAQSAAQRDHAAALSVRLARADAAGKAALASDYYQASTNTNRIVLERAADTAFVLQRLDAVLAAIPGWQGRPSGTGVHLAGFSLGGAVATAVALGNPHVRSVVNLDGGTQGPVDVRALQTPYLMLYSEANRGINDRLLPPQAHREAPPGTRHLNYHDLAGVVPALRFTSALGSTDPTAFLRSRNHLVHGFLQKRDA